MARLERQAPRLLLDGWTQLAGEWVPRALILKVD